MERTALELERHEDVTQSATEQLLERSWGRRERRASQRELVVDAVAAALFVAAAGALLLAAGGTRPHAGQVGPFSGTAVLLIAVYALVGRIEFAVGAGYVVPTQLILVPMLLVCPRRRPRRGGRRDGAREHVDWTFGRVPPRRVLSAVPDAWHASGRPWSCCSPGHPRSASVSCRCWRWRSPRDACWISRARSRGCGSPAWCPSSMCRSASIALVWAVDLCLAPLGFLAAIATRPHPGAILLVLPLVFLLWLLARDRSTADRQGPPPAQARGAGAGPPAVRGAAPGRRVRGQARAQMACSRSSCMARSRRSTPTPAGWSWTEGLHPLRLSVGVERLARAAAGDGGDAMIRASRAAPSAVQTASSAPAAAAGADPGHAGRADRLAVVRRARAGRSRRTRSR